jgi:hypothetical protein
MMTYASTQLGVSMLRSLDIDLLRKIMSLDAQAGKAVWLQRTPDMFIAKGQLKPESLCASFNTRIAGTPALDCLDKKNGYLCGNIFGTRFQAHRVFWAMHSGQWPDGDIDHINGDRKDNRIANLRSVTRTENLKNSSIGRRNTSGVLGVYWANDRKMWRVEIGHESSRIKVGSFPDFEDAIAARRQAEEKYGYHPNHGKPK